MIYCPHITPETIQKIEATYAAWVKPYGVVTCGQCVGKIELPTRYIPESSQMVAA